MDAGDGADRSSIQNINELTADSMPVGSEDVTVDDNVPPVAIYYLVNFQYICVITALLPLVTLFICFVTAYVFQYDEVHETHCRVSRPPIFRKISICCSELQLQTALYILAIYECRYIILCHPSVP